MKYLIYAGLMASMLIGLTAASIPSQPVQAQSDICIQNPDACILVPIRWLQGPPDDDDCPMCGLLDWRNILTIPDNQAVTISVKRGAQSDMVIFDIPKTLTQGIAIPHSNLLNTSAAEGFIGPNTLNTSAMPQ